MTTGSGPRLPLAPLPATDEGALGGADSSLRAEKNHGKAGGRLLPSLCASVCPSIRSHR